MPFTRPTLSELVARIKVDIETGLGIIGSGLRRAITTVIAKAIAGATHLLYGHQVWIAKQVFPDTADGDNLRRWGSIWNVVQIEAEFASGTGTSTGNVDGTTIPADTILTRSDGKEYKVVDSAEIDMGTATLNLIAVVAEEDGNCDVGTVLSFSSPIAGVNSSVTIVTMSGGADIETEDAYRTRLLERIARRP